MSNTTQQNKESPHADFGYQIIPASEKAAKVAEVFHSVAARYDLMNDVMSLGMHRFWKLLAVDLSQVKADEFVLDVAGGTADLAKLFAKKMNDQGKVVLLDINDSMLRIGRDRLIDAGLIHKVAIVQANAENLPFSDNTFDCLSIGFGLRNVTNKLAALQSMYRVIKPGGRLLVLEFSKPVLGLMRTLYDRYSFDLLPKLGKWIAKDADSYQYLVESIRKHPDQETLKTLILSAGFDQCEYNNLSGGIVALHRAWKY